MTSFARKAKARAVVGVGIAYVVFEVLRIAAVGWIVLAAIMQ